jgi:hypothetical protein
MTNSHTEAWDKVRSLEDIQALLASVDARRKLIRTHAWREGSWDVVFAEATVMRDELEALRERLTECWEDLVGDARGQGA